MCRSMQTNWSIFASNPEVTQWRLPAVMHAIIPFVTSWFQRSSVSDENYIDGTFVAYLMITKS